MDRSRLPHNGRRAPRGRPAFAAANAKADSAVRQPRKRECGFTLLEVIIAVVILSTGLLAVALLVATSAHGTERSRYMSMASGLASEKIEDLMRYPSSDPQVAVPAGSVGSLTAPDAAPQTISGVTVYYSDDVQLSAAGGQTANGFGAITQVQNAPSNCGGSGYNIFTYQPNGTVSDTQCNATAPAAGSDVLTFHRRWLIESPVTINGNTINGVRRITVVVTLTNAFENPPVTFQMSAIRQ